MQYRIRAFVLCGVALGLSATQGFSQLGTGRHARKTGPPSGTQSARFKQIGASAGDVNGDGRGDVIKGFVASYLGMPWRGEVQLQLGQSSGLAPVSWRVEGVQGNAHLGAALGPAGDVNGDGFDDVLVGAPGFIAHELSEGRAYLYLGSAQGLAGAPAWTTGGGQTDAQFGAAVAGAGDVNGDGYDDVLVGAPSFDAGQPNEGCVFLYLGGASGLAATPAWIGEGGQDGAWFGSALSSAGDVDGDGYDDVLVGAPGDDTGALDAGRAYVYSGLPAGLAAAPSWTAEGLEIRDRLGWSVAAGDVNEDGFADVMLGIPYRDGAAEDEGAVWAYWGSAAGIATTPSWSAAGEEQRSRFGWSVATADLNGDGFSELLVGAPGDDLAAPDAGRVFLFRGTPMGLKTEPGWTAPGDRRDLWFGASVTSAGDIEGDGKGDLIVGVDALGLGPSEDGTRVFSGADIVLPPEYDWMVVAPPDYGLGYTVASAGDIDRDGYDDVVITGASGVFGDALARVYAYMGSPAGLSSSADWGLIRQVGPGGTANASGAGDVNGDGYGDLIVGCPNDLGSAGSFPGRAFVFHGGSSGLSTQPDWEVASEQVDEQCGYSATSAGDVNGDGYADIAVVGYAYVDAENEVGRARVYLGSSAGVSTTPAWTRIGTPGAGGQIHAASPAGDVNGDGYDDLIVARSWYQYCDVFLGSAAGLSTDPAWTMTGKASGAGDVNADGFADVIRAETNYSNPEANEGAVFLHLGSPSGLSTTVTWFAEGNQPWAKFGTAATCAGDVNGDGFNDVVVTATGVHRAYLYLGTSSGLSGPIRIVSEPSLGWSASTAGDVDGDGFDDWLVGAPPAAFLYLGRP